MEIPLTYLKQKNIIISNNKLQYSDKEILLQCTANISKKYFDLKLKLKKNNDIIKSVCLSFEDFFNLFINSTYFKIVDFNDFAKFNLIMLFQTIHQALMVE